VPAFGSVNSTVVPFPGLLKRVTVPLWFSMMVLVIASPRPAPGIVEECALAARKNRVKAWLSSWAFMPIRVSVTSQLRAALITDATGQVAQGAPHRCAFVMPLHLER
jgi:hypothetical protein